jgi:hypothetical protein
MRYVLFDTCTWVDLCGSIQLWPLLDTIESAVNKGGLRVLVPEVVHLELAKHVPTAATRTVKATKTRLRELRNALPTLLSHDISALLRELDRVNSLLDATPGRIERVGKRVMALTANGIRLDTSEGVYKRVVDRGLRKIAPFHAGAKNSTADAVIVEVLLEHAKRIRESGDNRAIDFVSSNTSDFSSATNHNQPHNDFEADFSAARISYHSSLVPLVETVSKELDSEEEQKRLTRIIDAGHLRDRLPVDVTMPLSETCYGCGKPAVGGYRPSPGGLSWVMYCPACGWRRDTGEYFD